MHTTEGVLEGRAVIRQRIWLARLVVFVTFLDLFIQFPVVAPYARGLGASPTLVGVIVGIYSATNLVGNLVAGPLLDRHGRARPVLIGLLLSAAALLAYALAGTPEQMVAARAVHGLATAVLTPGAFAILGDAAQADRRARTMGGSGALIAIAAVVGPPLAGIVRDRLGPGAVFLGGAGLMLLAAGLFALGLRTTDMADGAAPRARARAVWTGAGGLLTGRRLVAAYLAALALTVGLGTLVTHLPLVLEAQGESAARRGIAFTVYAVVALVVMAGPVTRLTDRHERAAPLAAGLALVGAGLLTLALVGGAGGAALGMGVFGLGFGLLFPAATALVTDATRPAERGTAFGIFYAVYSFGVVLGALLSGRLAEGAGLSGAPFLASGVLALAAAPAVLLIARRVVAAAPASKRAL